MSLDISFWIVAWLMMAAAFLTATGAIVIGALNLDRESKKRENERKRL